MRPSHIKLYVCAGLQAAVMAQSAWSQTSLSGMTARERSAIVYDQNRGVTVLFGGFDGFNNLGDTWEWNGSAWSQATTGGPPARSSYAMVYDTQRNRTVLFGGTGNGLLADTWEWNGAVWSQVATGGPPARSNHAMAYDSHRGRTVLFGGNNGTADTWEWNGSAWLPQVFASGPSARYGHAMAFDRQRHKTVLYGGYSGSPMGDTWEWDGTTWTNRSSTGPVLAMGHVMAYDSQRGRTVITGGWTGSSYQPHRWEWDGTAWAQVGTAEPAASGMAYDDQRSRLVLVGPGNGIGTISTWESAGPSWSLVAATCPSRSNQASSFDAGRGRVVMFGGRTPQIQGNTFLLRDTWEWNGITWTQASNNGPAASEGHAMAYDSSRGLTVLFGGTGSAGAFISDTWNWDGATWTRQSAASPPGRFNHAMVYDVQRHRIVMFGGIVAGGFLVNDTWEWDGLRWQSIGSSGPRARHGHSMAYDPQRNRTVLFGGLGTNNTYLGDTWEFIGVNGAWLQSASQGPSPRNEHAMAFASLGPLGGRTVLYGGKSNATVLGDTWEWDGVAWHQVPVAGPSARSETTITHDPQRGRTILFGGNSSIATFGDTWELVRTLAATASAYGQGCGNPALNLSADPNGPPIIGTSARVSLLNLPSSVGFVSVGWNRTTFGSFALPLTLAGFGLPGCNLLQSADAASQSVTLTSPGNATYSLYLPNWGGLIGLRVYLQGWGLAPGANAGNAIVSNGLEWIIGNS